MIALELALTYLVRILFRFLNSYLSHKAAWNLVADMRVKVYDHLQKLSLRFYHDKQTGSSCPGPPTIRPHSRCSSRTWCLNCSGMFLS